MPRHTVDGEEAALLYNLSSNVHVATGGHYDRSFEVGGQRDFELAGTVIPQRAGHTYLYLVRRTATRSAGTTSPRKTPRDPVRCPSQPVRAPASACPWATGPRRRRRTYRWHRRGVESLPTFGSIRSPSRLSASGRASMNVVLPRSGCASAKEITSATIHGVLADQQPPRTATQSSWNPAQFEAVGESFVTATSPRRGPSRRATRIQCGYRDVSLVRPGRPAGPGHPAVTHDLQYPTRPGRSYDPVVLHGNAPGGWSDRADSGWALPRPLRPRIKDEWWFGHRHMIVDLNGDLCNRSELNEI